MNWLQNQAAQSGCTIRLQDISPQQEIKETHASRRLPSGDLPSGELQDRPSQQTRQTDPGAGVS